MIHSLHLIRGRTTAFVCGWMLLAIPLLAQFIQQGPKLVGLGVASAAQEGSAVALSLDGNTAIVGAPGDGDALIYTRTNGAWSPQGGPLVGTGAVGISAQGYSVAISSDGNTAVVGGGNVDVFTRSNGVWTQQGAKLVGSGAGGLFGGNVVAVSGDGNTILAGVPQDEIQGAVWVFTRSNGIWTQQGGKLVASLGSANFGQSISLSYDGDTAIIGSPGDGDSGAAYIYTRANGAWTQGSRLVAGGQPAVTRQGYSVSLSSDGKTAAAANTSIVYIFTQANGFWSQQGAGLVGSDASFTYKGDKSISLSADGNTLVSGAADYNLGVAIWIFTRVNGAWLQKQSKLTGTDATTPKPYASAAVALSSDGSTAIIGADFDSKYDGASWVFNNSSGIWTQQGPKLKGSTRNEGYAFQGSSVALSANGNTALIGGPSDSPSGATWVFTRSGGVWSQQGLKLVGMEQPVNLYSSAQGAAVGLSADGNTAIIGAPRDNGGFYGAAWIFARSNGVWTQQGSKLVAPVLFPGAQQGIAVALSGDGNTAIVGGSEDANYFGSAWIYTRSNGTWTQQGPRLHPDDATNNMPHFGSSVALSADGNTAVVGAYNDGDKPGAVWVFTRSNGVWTQEGLRLAASEAEARYLGSSVALSADGSIVLVGGGFAPDNYSYSPLTAAGWVFLRTSGVWHQVGSKLLGSGALPHFSRAKVALSADGNIALVGDQDDEAAFPDNIHPSANRKGAVWVFKRSNGAWVQEGSKLTGTGAIGGASFGASLAISADGTTAIAGGPFDDHLSTFGIGRGAAWVFFAGAPVPVTITSVPSGMRFSVTGTNCPVGSGYITPATLSWTPLVTCAVTFASQPLAGTNYFFSRWEDGSTASTRNITAPTIGATFSGRFSISPYTITPTSANVLGTAGSGFVAVSAAPGYPVTAVTSAPWITVSTSGAAVNYGYSLNTGLARTGTITIGDQTFTLTQATTVPSVTESGPVVVSGTSQTITIKFSHPQGFQQLGVVNVLINQYLSGDTACFVAYSQPLGVLYLVNDGGSSSGLSPGLVLGASGSVSNGQCTISSTGSYAVGAVNTLILTLNIAFKSSFTGAKSIYAAAQSLINVSTGWQTVGAALIPEPITYPRSIGTVSSSAKSAIVSFQFDGGTAGRPQTSWALINSALDGRGACFVAYYAPGNTLYLYPDNGDGAAAPHIELKQGNALENSQCRVSVGNYPSSSTILVVNFTFKSDFAGAKGVWTAVQTSSGQTSPWRTIGAWQVPP